MALIPVSDASQRTTVEVRTTALANNTMLRVFVGPRSENVAADLRLSPDEARALAASLLHEAGKQDGKRVSFFWHASDCDPLAIANDTCTCSGKPVSA